MWLSLCSHLSLLKQLGQVTHCLTSACAVDAFSDTASALYTLQAFNASQLVCPHVLDANMSRLLTRGSAACHSSQDLMLMMNQKL